MATGEVYGKSTIGEIVFASVLSCVVAALAAIVGFVGGIFLCGLLFSGEARESALHVGPTLALLSGSAVFVICFRKIITYGDR